MTQLTPRQLSGDKALELSESTSTTEPPSDVACTTSGVTAHLTPLTTFAYVLT
jgi:hypothetical protein